MDVRRLRQILAIRQHGSFAKAARALGISQPSLSKSIGRLEDELGAPIFKRGAGGSELTPTGEVIAERASRVIEETFSLVQAARLTAGGRAGLLRIGFNNVLKQPLAVPLIADIAERHPDLSLQILCGDHDRLLPALAARDLDIVFCVLDPVSAGTEHQKTKVLSTFAVAVASPEHPLARLPHVQPYQFARFNYAGPRTAAFAVKAVFGIGANDGDVTSYISNDFDLFEKIVSSGQATCFMPAFEAAQYVRAGKYVVLNVDLSVALDFVALVPESAAGSPLIKEVVQMARKIGAAIEDDQESLRPAEASDLMKVLS